MVRLYNTSKLMGLMTTVHANCKISVASTDEGARRCAPTGWINDFETIWLSSKTFIGNRFLRNGSPCRKAQPLTHPSIIRIYAGQDDKLLYYSFNG